MLILPDRVDCAELVPEARLEPQRTAGLEQVEERDVSPEVCKTSSEHLKVPKTLL